MYQIDMLMDFHVWNVTLEILHRYITKLINVALQNNLFVADME